MERPATIKLKIRGIYATALTRFFLDGGLLICEPSPVILARFKDLPPSSLYETADLEVMDLDNSQGILVTGPPVMVETVIRLLRETLFDAVCRRRDVQDGLSAEIEFPSSSKSALDEIRNGIVPTLIHHHRFRIIAPEEVDLVEQEDLAADPFKRESLSRILERHLIWDAYASGKSLAIEHVKPDGKIIPLSEGEIVEMDDAKGELILKRTKFRGRLSYDGLNIAKHEGDYAVSRIREGLWYYQHTYHRASGEPIGSYYNINTPVEFYPDRIRYLDLEIDVVSWPDGRVEVIDEGELERRHRSGHLTDVLKEHAGQTARDLRQSFLEGIGRRDCRVPPVRVSP